MYAKHLLVQNFAACHNEASDRMHAHQASPAMRFLPTNPISFPGACTQNVLRLIRGQFEFRAFLAHLSTPCMSNSCTPSDPTCLQFHHEVAAAYRTPARLRTGRQSSNPSQCLLHVPAMTIRVPCFFGIPQVFCLLHPE